jgi:peptide/nickel transport system permease protein
MTDARDQTTQTPVPIGDGQTTLEELHLRPSPKRRFSLRGAPKIAVATMVVLVLVSLLAPVLAQHDPELVDLRARLLPPVGFSTEVRTPEGDEIVSGSWDHPLGTDQVGRDILARLMYGARLSLGVALLAMLFGAVLGTTVGLVSGYLGGATDTFIMRFVDILYSFPVVLLALLLTVVRGPGFANVLIAMVFILWTRFARVVRGESLTLRSREFVVQAKVNGGSTLRIVFGHILPNTFPTVIVLITLLLGWTILIEASLSFLGAGLPPTTPAWGVMIDSGQQYLRNAWWVATVPGFAIMLTVLAFNILGDWLRDVLDPKLSHVWR